MFRLDGMLMIGSAGANVGKTELASALIKKFCKSRDIVGIKVTTIRAKDGQCPRGGWGCGVCSSLDGDFCITQETNRDSGKDTGRLLAAGANRVFWLRVMKTHREKGVKALLNIIGPGAISVCESNSLRAVVEPGVFLIVRGRNAKTWKSSANEVRQYADKIVVSDKGRFDLDLNRINLIDGRWVMQEQATAIIMAGGDSSRMGTDKSMLPIKGRPMIEVICEQLCGTFGQIIISANEADKYSYLGLPIVPDKIPGQGPLMGIASTLEVSGNELNFVVACDIPQIDLAYVRRMVASAEGVDPVRESKAREKTKNKGLSKGVDIVVPRTGDEGTPFCNKSQNGNPDKYEPLFAIYRKSALEAINEVLSAGGRKISDVFARCRVKYIEFQAEQFTNLNTMAEYKEFQKKCDE